MLFNVVITLPPTEDEAKAGKEETILVGPVVVVAKDQMTANLKVCRKEGKDISDEDMSRAIVSSQPFFV
jgi:hypothetical protein